MHMQNIWFRIKLHVHVLAKIMFEETYKLCVEVLEHGLPHLERHSFLHFQILIHSLWGFEFYFALLLDNLILYKTFVSQCFPSLNCAFWDDLNVSRNAIASAISDFLLSLFHLCSDARISMTRGTAFRAAFVSRNANLDLRAIKSTTLSQYSYLAQYATSASR